VTTLVCSDLDRTLIYSAAALGEGDHDPASGAAAALRCVVYQGGPLSYLTQTAAERLELLATTALMVPTTTRTPEQYAMVRLPGGPHRFAICANGGHLLVDGGIDGDWAEQVRTRTAGGATTAEVVAHLAAVRGDFVAKLRVASGLFCYLVVDRAGLPARWLEDLTGWCSERGWITSLQGRKVYCLPRVLTKSAAAIEVARRTGAVALLAAGDSLLDGELLETADAAIRPAHGELAEVGWISDRTEVTVARGALAGEEITGWLLARALDPALIPATGPWRAALSSS
jgi:hypothetical protein